MLLDFLGFLHISFIDVLDIIVVAAVLYGVFHWLKGSSAVNIFVAIMLLFVIRIVAMALNMELLSSLLDTVIDVGAIALIIIFQPEIRQFLNRIGRSTGITGERRDFLSRLLKRDPDALSEESAKEIAQACKNMAESNTGALIVLMHTNSLQDIIDTGDRLDADVRCRLIENIFFKNSPMHDGAIIIGDNRIIAARCTLPMTERTNLPAKYGMRHKSAVGISERSDADVIVVSEQRGEISFVHEGIITPIRNRSELKLKLEPKNKE